MAPDGANFQVLIVNDDERRTIRARLQEFVPNVTDATVKAVEQMPLSTFCIAFAFTSGQSATFTKGIAVIRAEHPDALRLSCIHEEIAQALGLSNDSLAARPSIFNDAKEFGTLTWADELMLKMLYDDRLRPGMTEAEAAPLVEVMAAELMGGQI